MMVNLKLNEIRFKINYDSNIQVACEDQVLVALVNHSTKKPNSKWRMPLTDPQHAYKSNTAPRSAPTRGAYIVGLTWHQILIKLILASQNKKFQNIWQDNF